ncbi:hypothetical protein CLOSBL3_40007 [Clostridiaceae bacterium BL-3]|nr:hypothetical protein CLOSBL3_40007 [Clostridiaceae bacterium BL-3]
MVAFKFKVPCNRRHQFTLAIMEAYLHGIFIIIYHTCYNLISYITTICKHY